MLIQNNSTNLMVNYISILINQNFNNSCNVTDIYKNSVYNDFSIDDDCVCSNLIGYNFSPTAIYDRLSYCKIDYVGGTVENIVIDQDDLNESQRLMNIVITSDFGTNPLLRKKKLLYQVTTTNECYGKPLKEDYRNYLMGLANNLTEEEKQDFRENFIYIGTYNVDKNAQYNTGKFLTKEINDNDRFFEDKYSIVIPKDTTIYCRKSTMKRADSLSANIASFLNSRYPILIERTVNVDTITNTTNNVDNLTELLNSDICKYFTSTDKSFNADKKDFDIDDFISSFIIGRTITPISTMEEIEYVQRLLEDSFYLTYSANVYGEWDKGLTNALYDYQVQLNKRYSNNKNTVNEDGTINKYNYNVIIPTGYFDIITEKYLLQDKSLLKGDLNNAYSSI